MKSITQQNPIVAAGIALLASIALLVPLAFASAAVNATTPSTNDINRTNGWAYVDVVTVGVGEIELKFTNERSFASCFEYRTDGDTSQVIASNGGVNYNPAVTDGLYPFTCLNNNETTKLLEANEYVEVRMVFGAEADERFDWTRFDVLPAPEAEMKSDCLDGGWEEFGFKNQGQCVRFIETGKDSR